MLKFLFTYKACTNRGPDPNPVIISGNLNHQLWKPSCIFQGAQGQIYHLQAPCLKIRKIFFMRKKEETACLFFNFYLDGEWVCLVLVFFKGNFLFDWTCVWKLYITKGYATTRAGDQFVLEWFMKPFFQWFLTVCKGIIWPAHPAVLCTAYNLFILVNKKNVKQCRCLICQEKEREKTIEQMGQPKTKGG